MKDNGRGHPQRYTVCIIIVIFSRPKFQKYFQGDSTIWEAGKEEGVMSQYGNGFRDSILNVFTIVKEYLLF